VTRAAALAADPVLAAPSGRAVRRWTARTAARRAEGGLLTLLSEVYSAVVSVAIVAALLFGVAEEFGAASLLSPPPPEGALVVLPLGWVAVLLAGATLAALLGLVLRLGPVSLSPPQSAWWLPLPADRRTLLRPAAARWPLLAALVGALGGTALALALAVEQPARLAAFAGLGAGTAASTALLASLCQDRPATHQRLRRLADAALGAVPLLGLLLAVARPGAPVPGAAVLPAAAVALVTAVGLAVALDRRTDRVPHAVLRQRGVVAGSALDAVLWLDSRALGRALTERSAPPVRARSSRLGWLARVPPRWRPAAALISADALLLLREPRRLGQLAATALLPALAAAVPGVSPLVLAAVVVGGGYLAALATAEGARQGQVRPVLDALLPLAAVQVRRCRLVVPVVLLVGWSVLPCTVLALQYGQDPAWLALGGLAAPVWAAAAVRAAYRPLPDFSGPPIATPMGPVPSGLGTVVSQGPDVALLGSLPLVAALLGVAPTSALVVQAVAAVAALAVAARLPAPED
jgi:hypothetical protein